MIFHWKILIKDFMLIANPNSYCMIFFVIKFDLSWSGGSYIGNHINNCCLASSISSQQTYYLWLIKFETHSINCFYFTKLLPNVNKFYGRGRNSNCIILSLWTKKYWCSLDIMHKHLARFSRYDSQFSFALNKKIL